uniref:Chemokine interleukin-8-like domain-containing protein n=1 Tax=Electrophorus electricus TaxID=8005 RepID=A0AAY5EIE4_ELEEL
ISCQRGFGQQKTPAMSRSTLVLLLLFALTCAELSRCLCRSFNKAHLKNIQNWKVFHPINWLQNSSFVCCLTPANQDKLKKVTLLLFCVLRGMLKNNRKQFCLDPSSRAWKTIMYAYRVSV